MAAVGLRQTFRRPWDRLQWTCQLRSYRCDRFTLPVLFYSSRSQCSSHCGSL